MKVKTPKQKKSAAELLRIPFNKPFLTGREAAYILETIGSGQLSGNGPFTKKCQDFFKKRFGFQKALLTTSGTDALEMATLLLGIGPSDEVIVPSYTFVSCANAFILRGARVVFADSNSRTPHLDASKIESLVTQRTKAIVPVHYGGIACEMDALMSVAKRHGLFVIEDAAQALGSYYKGQPVGSFGDCAAFSFHESKNITSGEGGLLVINNPRFGERAEILWEKGTNRAAFSRGEVAKYEWLDVGSSYLPSEITAAFLLAQLEMLESIQKKRVALWNEYHRHLKPLEDQGILRLPSVPENSSHNGHLFYILTTGQKERADLMGYLKHHGVETVFHYLPLHTSPFYRPQHDGRNLVHAIHYAECLLRLPLYYELTVEEVSRVCRLLAQFYQ